MRQVVVASTMALATICLSAGVVWAQNAAAGSATQSKVYPSHVNGQVWLLAGEPGESNVAVQVGDDGALLVDTGTQSEAPKLLDAIQGLIQNHAGDQKTLSVIIDTNGRLDHIGGNAVIAAAGSQIMGGHEAADAKEFAGEKVQAEVLAEQNVLTRLVQEQSTSGQHTSHALWPTITEDFDLYNMTFDGEAVQVYHPHYANTDGQLIVFFRQSNVIAAGDVVDMSSYPIIDVARGGTIDGELVALNKVIEMAVPAAYAEGGTVVIPGHGALCDQADVESYKNMITTIRNRIQFYKNEGKSLEQVLALEPGAGWDERWGAASGPGSAREFITAVYRTLPAKGPPFSMHTVTLVPSTATVSGGRQY
ncbi:MAG: MBL fold metallo-hydrolase [Steroidobacteraceae bacterium]